MNATKKINVNFSSLVGLKAELLRKQTEVNQAKLRSEQHYSAPKVKKKPEKVKETKLDEKSKKLTDVDDINSHKKSRLMLEAKSRMYDRLKRSKHNNEHFLVDFTNKSDESEDDLPKEESEEEFDMDVDEEGWVEYQDCFGRTRKCLREDLPMMQKKDELLKDQIMDKQNKESKNDTVPERKVEEEKEPEIVLMRRKWEEQTQKLADKANIHYQDILFDEARAHGVGYYAFSQDEEERAKQQEMLAKLRKETEQKQRQMQELKDLRSKMEENRLKAARIRKRIRAGLPAEPTEEEIGPQPISETDANGSQTKSDTEKIENIPEVESKPEKSTSEEKSEETENDPVVRENKIKALGELLGKRTHWYEMSQEEWVEKRRKLRINEFGPVYENFERAGYLNSQGDKEDFNTNSTDEINMQEKDVQSENKEQLISNVDHSNVNNDAPTLTNTSTTSETDLTSNENLNEDHILAGLRYLREKFEETHNT